MRGNDCRLELMTPKEDIGITISRNDIVDVLRVLAEQVLDFESYYFLSGILVDFLNNRYATTLSFKWYIFAFNAMTYRMEMSCAKLLSSHFQDMSFYNILRYICQEHNYRFFVDEFNDNDFNAIINDFNKQVLPVFNDIKKRRNKLNAHNDKGYLLNAEKRKLLVQMNTGMYYNAWWFLKGALNKLYRLYTGEDLFDFKKDEQTIIKCQTQIERFVSSLNDMGDLD